MYFSAHTLNVVERVRVYQDYVTNTEHSEGSVYDDGRQAGRQAGSNDGGRIMAANIHIHCLARTTRVRTIRSQLARTGERLLQIAIRLVVIMNE